MSQREEGGSDLQEDGGGGQPLPRGEPEHQQQLVEAAADLRAGGSLPCRWSYHNMCPAGLPLYCCQPLNHLSHAPWLMCCVHLLVEPPVSPAGRDAPRPQA